MSEKSDFVNERDGSTSARRQKWLRFATFLERDTTRRP
jgi:hypothetical protein